MAPLTLAEWPSSEPVIRLPQPYHTAYFPSVSSKASPTSSKLFQLKGPSTSDPKAQTPVEPLHNDSLYFSEPEDLKSSERPADSNNTPWARARRSPASALAWDGELPPTLAQAWLIVYVLFTIRPEEEFIRLALAGKASAALADQLRASMLAINHPLGNSHNLGNPDELVLLRAAFWQGAGAPFGARSAWVPTDGAGTTYASQAVPALTHVLTNDPAGGALTWHPRRAPKPRPGSTVYSRYIPHLREEFSMVALDYTNAEHLGLFHTWQNDPRVSAGWNETGTLEQHREYLRRMHEDPHQFAVLAAFDGVFFAYFEIYWAREDRLGAYYGSLDFDRGRHSLVGDVRYRGAHRVGAWWSSLMHYLFLDDPRTMQVVGEPKFTNSTVLAYDLVHGFGVDKFVDLPHKRSAFMRCSRERFFQICPLAEDEKNPRKKVVGGTLVGLVPKL
ncbi:unnamed protein product [Discula destructiva]